jgi:hypothetical protein
MGQLSQWHIVSFCSIYILRFKVLEVDERSLTAEFRYPKAITGAYRHIAGIYWILELETTITSNSYIRDCSIVHAMFLDHTKSYIDFQINLNPGHSQHGFLSLPNYLLQL